MPVKSQFSGVLAITIAYGTHVMRRMMIDQRVAFALKF